MKNKITLFAICLASFLSVTTFAGQETMMKKQEPTMKKQDSMMRTTPTTKKTTAAKKSTTRKKKYRSSKRKVYPGTKSIDRTAARRQRRAYFNPTCDFDIILSFLNERIIDVYSSPCHL